MWELWALGAAVVLVVTLCVLVYQLAEGEQELRKELEYWKAAATDLRLERSREEFMGQVLSGGRAPGSPWMDAMARKVEAELAERLARKQKEGK